jgi:hypothetical protein
MNDPSSWGLCAVDVKCNRLALGKFIHESLLRFDHDHAFRECRVVVLPCNVSDPWLAVCEVA